MPLDAKRLEDGLQHPFQPRVDLTQTYDGTGTPAKRDQITRYPGIFDEFGNQSEPVEDTKTSYYVNSSVLGGAVIVELAIGWTNTVHIYAGGQRIAREEWGSVSFEHHNPVTGSWVTSNGHSSYRTTIREERDPLGAEVPLENPYSSAQSYVDWKSAQPLFIEGGDPFDYTSGRTIDGLPVSEAEFQRRAASGSVVTETLVFGPPRNKNGSPRLINGNRPDPTLQWQQNPLLEVVTGNSYIAEFPVVRYFSSKTEDTGTTFGVDTIAVQHNHAQTQNSGTSIPLKNLMANVFHLLDNNRCYNFVANIINVARQLTNKPPFTYDGYDLSQAIAFRQNEGGIIFHPGNGGGGYAKGDIFSGTAVVGIEGLSTMRDGRPTNPVGVQVTYALVALHEFIHLAGGADQYGAPIYSDYRLAEAAKILTGAPGYPSGPAPRTREEQDQLRTDTGIYWDRQLREHCSPTGG